MGNHFFGMEWRMGVVNIFGEEGWNGRPSKKLGWYPSLGPSRLGKSETAKSVINRILIQLWHHSDRGMMNDTKF